MAAGAMSHPHGDKTALPQPTGGAAQQTEGSLGQPWPVRCMPSLALPAPPHLRRPCGCQQDAHGRCLGCAVRLEKHLELGGIPLLQQLHGGRGTRAEPARAPSSLACQGKQEALVQGRERDDPRGRDARQHAGGPGCRCRAAWGPGGALPPPVPAHPPAASSPAQAPPP